MAFPVIAGNQMVSITRDFCFYCLLIVYIVMVIITILVNEKRICRDG